MSIATRIHARDVRRIVLLALVSFAGVPGGHAQDRKATRSDRAILSALPFDGMFGVYAVAKQDAGQGSPASPESPTPKLAEMPDGDGKAIVIANCQGCHSLGNVLRAHKTLDDWRDTVQTMIDRGASVPADKMMLIPYLAKNFGPKPEPAVLDQPTSAAPASAPPSASAQPKPVEMPEGDGKAIAVASCQTCHTLRNLTRAHKTLDDWRDTLQTMIDRGASVPTDKLEILAQYLAKNFGPKADTPDAGASPGGASSTPPKPE